MIDHRMTMFDVMIVGAGPAGLATAIAAQKRELAYLVLERGALVNTILHFPTNMVFFTTPELLEIGGLPFVTPYEKPTRVEALRYYRRAIDAYDLAIELGETVTRITSEPQDRGQRLMVEARSARGAVRQLQTRTVVIATGAYDLPNRCGIEGEDLPHVSHYYTEAHPYYRKRVVIVGGANSAADAALELYRSGVAVTIVHRGATFSPSIKYWVRPDLENRIKAGSIAARLEARVVRIAPESVVIEQRGNTETLPADAVFLLTGYHADAEFLKRAGIEIQEGDETPRFDPMTFETNVPGIYLAGQVTTGRNSGKIFIENGRFHGERVIEVIADRLAAAPPHVLEESPDDTRRRLAAAELG
jgi:thioredoxin reductase (NADPH)